MNQTISDRNDFSAVAREDRDRPAVATAGEQLTYGELNNRSEALASLLRAAAPLTFAPCIQQIFPAWTATEPTGNAREVELDPELKTGKILRQEDCRAG